MSYIDKSLGDGETVIARARFPWVYGAVAWAARSCDRSRVWLVSLGPGSAEPFAWAGAAPADRATALITPPARPALLTQPVGLCRARRRLPIFGLC